MKKPLLMLLLSTLLSIKSATAGARKEGLPLAGVPGWPPGFGYCVSVKGADYFGCVAANLSGADATFFKDLTRGMLQAFNGQYAHALADVSTAVIFPELGDAWDPKAPGYCVCAADSQPVDIGGSPFEKPTNSGKGGCTYWMACYIKGVPGNGQRQAK